MKNIELQKLDVDDSHKLFQLIDKNRDELREHLGWLDKNKTELDTKNFIEFKQKEEKELKSITYKIVYNDEIVGIIDLHDIEKNKADIGYWLDKDQYGKGIMTIAVNKLIDIGFNKYNFEILNIFCGINNVKSQNIAKRLNFKYIETIKDRENLYGRMVDNMHFQLLK